MLFVLAALLYAAWVVGVLTSTMFHGFIHVLPVLAVAAIIVRLIQNEPVR